MRLTLLGVGAMNSPRYAPAGLLVERRRRRVMLDGGPGAEPDGRLDAWLVTDERGELMREIRRLARARGLEPEVKTYSSGGLTIEPRLIVHTSHDAFGYLIEAGDGKAVLDVAREARRRGVRRLILAHIGRPTIRAIDAGLRPPFGEFGEEGKVYILRRTRPEAKV